MKIEISWFRPHDSSQILQIDMNRVQGSSQSYSKISDIDPRIVITDGRQKHALLQIGTAALL